MTTFFSGGEKASERILIVSFGRPACHCAGLLWKVGDMFGIAVNVRRRVPGTLFHMLEVPPLGERKGLPGRGVLHFLGGLGGMLCCFVFGWSLRVIGINLGAPDKCIQNRGPLFGMVLRNKLK